MRSFDTAPRFAAALGAFVIRAGACGGRDQPHDLVDILLYALKFSARQIELGLGSGNLGAGSDRDYLFSVDVNRAPAGVSQFDPNHRCAREGATTEWRELYGGQL